MIYKKLLELQKQNISLTKDGINPHFKSKYLTLDGLLEIYKPLLSDLELVIYHTTNDGVMMTTIMDLEDETKIDTSFVLATGNPQQIGSSITYAKRYNLGQLLNITTDEDDDGNKASQRQRFSKKDLEDLKKSKNPKEKIKEYKETREFSKEMIENVKEFLASLDS